MSKIYDTPLPSEHRVEIATAIDAHIQRHHHHLPATAKSNLKDIIAAGAQIGYNYRNEIEAPNLEECDATDSESETETPQPKKTRKAK